MADVHPIMFAYDGSPHARAAIERSRELLEPGPAVVVTVWPTLEETAAVALLALPQGVVADAVDHIDAATQDRAEETAAEGSRLAQEAGFDARPQAVRCAGAIWAALVKCAEELDASSIVMGSRGRSAPAATFLGSVSTGVLHHAHRPVLVVRAPES